MENKDLMDQLAGLFSDLKDVPPARSDQAEAKSPPRRQRTPARLGEETLFTTKQIATNAPETNSVSEAKPETLPTVVAPEPTAVRSKTVIHWPLLLGAVLMTLGVILLVMMGAPIFSTFTNPEPTSNAIALAVSQTSTPTATASATPTQPPTTPAKALAIAEATSTPTPLAGGGSLLLKPSSYDTGWLVSEEKSELFETAPANHFGDSFLYSGVLEGKVYMGAFQFDLRNIPRGSQVHAAGLNLVGLRADQLDQAQNGEWQLQMLASEIDDRWSDHHYQQIANSQVIYTFEPLLYTEMLAEETDYHFEFDAQALAFLEQRILQGGDNFGRKISFRLVGPTKGEDNLFAWDSGYGPASKGKGPELFLSIGPPPAETPLPYYVVITSTPTPQNIVTAAAISVKMTAQAEKEGTATPLPPNWITPFAVTATPPPENAATAQTMHDIATAIALTTGEPPALVLATATPTFVIVTSTPTAETIETAVAVALRTTNEAAQYGTATPLPENWVTPAVVTVTPTPENDATVQYHKAVALTTGTPTPMPANVQTATATPVLVAMDPLAVPTATATPSPTPQTIPPALLGKIIFLSDREGATEEERARADRLGVKPEVIPAAYVLDPETGEFSRLTDIWPYQVVTAREGWSANETYQTYVKQLLWTNVKTPSGNKATEVFAVHYYDYEYNVERAVTNFGTGIAYDPVWSPVSNEIALVATESGNDEIWRINHDGTDPVQLTKNSWEWDKHPTWSPDGQQIVFYSNRTGNNQIWIMNKDGSDQRLLMAPNPYNDFDPVWVKSLIPAPALERQPDWRFVKPEGEAPAR
ncbi:MAG: PD40 domain-containing protein [Anaerolineae bacterium]|nr:PD40 domain-containing protein [Anaerolineae bacterium]